MALTTKKYLDSTGVSTLWSAVKTELAKKQDVISSTNKLSSSLVDGLGSLAAKSTVAKTDLADALKTEIEGKANSADLGTLAAKSSVAKTDLASALKTELEGKLDSSTAATTYAGIGYETKVTTLIGDDANKSVRTIANEELAAQLIPSTASDSLDTLQEIAAWIQAHPGDASAMNSAITALQTKVTLGKDETETEYATVKAYVEAYVAAQLDASDLSQYASASDLDALELLVGDTAVATQISNAITALNLSTTYYSKTSGEANAAAITAIKDGQNIDSFADVETALAGKQATIAENTYDAYGAASDVYAAITALTAAEVTALLV